MILYGFFLWVMQWYDCIKVGPKSQRCVFIFLTTGIVTWLSKNLFLGKLNFLNNVVDWLNIRPLEALLVQHFFKYVTFRSKFIHLSTWAALVRILFKYVSLMSKFVHLGGGRSLKSKFLSDVVNGWRTIEDEKISRLCSGFFIGLVRWRS